MRKTEVPPYDQINELPEEITATARKLAERIQEIDASLGSIDHLMNDAQPPVSGKLRIEWHTSKGKRYPRPVIWKRALAGHWRSEPISAVNLVSRVRTVRYFHNCAPLMKELARMASHLICLRQQTLARFAAFNRSAGGVLSSHKDTVWAYEARLDHLRGVVVRDWDIEGWK